jgi:hypothetical protein
MVGFYFTTIFFSKPTVNVTFKINHQYHQTLAFWFATARRLKQHHTVTQTREQNLNNHGSEQQISYKNAIKLTNFHMLRCVHIVHVLLDSAFCQYVFVSLATKTKM